VIFFFVSLGKFSPEESSECFDCSIGYSQPEEGKNDCNLCSGSFTTSGEGLTFCDACIEGYYYDENQDCIKCNSGMNCDGGDQYLDDLTLDSGFWRLNDELTEIIECPLKNACLGGNGTGSGLCAPRFKGPLCAVCRTGNFYAQAANTCRSCNFAFVDPLTIGLMIAIFGIIMVIIFNFSTVNKCIEKMWDAAIRVETDEVDDEAGETRHKIEEKLFSLQTKFKILVTFFQIISAYDWVLDVNFPSVFSNFLSFFSALNLSVNLIPLECFFEVNYLSTLMVATISPLIFSLFLGFVYFMSVRFAANDSERVKTQSYYFSLFLIISFLVFPGVSTGIFRSFQCHEVGNGESYLRVDYSIDCNGDFYNNLLLPYAGLMILLYPLGIPLMYFLLLWGVRDELDPYPDDLRKSQVTRAHDPDLRHLTFLFLTYRPKSWWFEVLECFRRLILTAGLVFFLDGTAMQIVIGMALALGAVKILGQVKPYYDRIDSILAEITQWAIFFTLFSALLIRVEVADPDKGDVDETTFAIILIVINCIAPLAALCILFYEFVLKPEEDLLFTVQETDETDLRILTTHHGKPRQMDWSKSSRNLIIGSSASDEGSEISETISFRKSTPHKPRFMDIIEETEGPSTTELISFRKDKDSALLGSEGGRGRKSGRNIKRPTPISTSRTSPPSSRPAPEEKKKTTKSEGGLQPIPKTDRQMKMEKRVSQRKRERRVLDDSDDKEEEVRESVSIGDYKSRRRRNNSRHNVNSLMRLESGEFTL